MRFRPLHDRVLVRRVTAEEKTAGGIIIPDTAKEKPQEGEIVAAGPGARNEKGDLVALDESVGGAWQVPSGGAVDLLVHDLGSEGVPATRTQAALVLAAAGNRPTAMRLLRAGVRDHVAAGLLLETGSA